MSRNAVPQGDALSKSIDLAIGGNTRQLFDLLTRGSFLPSPRINETLVEHFADECRTRGARADRLAQTMASLDPDAAPGATVLEFLPVCGIAALGARAAVDDAAFEPMLEAIHESADDMRFRVRDAVVGALVTIGARRGDALLTRLAPWMDGLFHAAAVLRGLADNQWLTQISRGDEAIARMDEAYVLARDAQRAAARYPGHKALVEVLASTPRAVAARFGVPVFDMLIRWTATKEPFLRDAIEKNLIGSRMAGRFAPEVERVRAAMKSTTAPPRNPDHYFGPTRGRGKKAKKR